VELWIDLGVHTFSFCDEVLRTAKLHCKFQGVQATLSDPDPWWSSILTNYVSITLV
jgi:hypothetical protein